MTNENSFALDWVNEFSFTWRREGVGAAVCWKVQALTNSDLPRSFGTVKLDGGEIPMVATSSGPVRVRGALGNPVNGVSLFGTKMHVAGHWAYVEPLAPGSHVLEIHGGDGHGWTTSVQAEVTVS